jgi:IclR family acetate operon transcriptional repressor
MSQAAEKALLVLRHVAAQPEPVTAMSVAGSLDLDKSTCSRMLALLVNEQWLVRDDHTRLFSAGPTLVGLSAKAAVSNQLQSILLPVLSMLRAQTGETVSFHRRVGDHRVCVAGLESQQQIRRVLPIGDSFPLPLGPSGKAILAFIVASQREELMAAVDDDTARQVRFHLTMVHETGAVSADGDHIIGVGAVSVPVFDSDGVFGSLTIAGPSPRWHADRRRLIRPYLLQAAESISRALGALDEPYRDWVERCSLPRPATV